MYKITRTPLSVEGQRVYPKMIHLAYRWKGRTYTVSDLLKNIPNRLTTNDKRRIGRKFSAYAKKNPERFRIIAGKGNHKYYTR